MTESAAVASPSEDDRLRTFLQRFSVGFGTLYFLSLFLLTSAELSGWVQRQFATADIREHGWLSVVVVNPLPILGFAILLLVFARSGVRESTRIVFWRAGLRLGPVMLAGLAVAFGTAAFGVWPWTWRSPESRLPILAVALIQGRQYGAIVFYAVTVGVFTPVVEEFIFRFGLLHYLKQKSGSSWWAILVGATLFGFVHLGNIALITPFALRNVVFVTLFRAVAGKLAVNGDYRIARPVILHAARDGLEVIFLFWAVFRNM